MSVRVVAPPAPMDLYDHGLAGRQVFWESSDRSGWVPVASWRAQELPGDTGLIDRCLGPTLDLGCGPGRLTAALTSAGRICLGVDLNATAIQIARQRGAPALRRDLFTRLPLEGHWSHILLADGNLGIAGDPLRLLARCRGLLSRQGSVLIDVGEPGTGLQRRQVRLRTTEQVSGWFPWAWVDLAALTSLAPAVGFEVADSWTSAQRHQAELRPATRWPTPHLARGA